MPIDDGDNSANNFAAQIAELERRLNELENRPDQRQEDRRGEQPQATQEPQEPEMFGAKPGAAAIGLPEGAKQFGARPGDSAIGLPEGTKTFGARPGASAIDAGGEPQQAQPTERPFGDRPIQDHSAEREEAHPLNYRGAGSHRQDAPIIEQSYDGALIRREVDEIWNAIKRMIAGSVTAATDDNTDNLTNFIRNIRWNSTDKTIEVSYDGSTWVAKITTTNCVGA